MKKIISITATVLWILLCLFFIGGRIQRHVAYKQMRVYADSANYFDCVLNRCAKTFDEQWDANEKFNYYIKKHNELVTKLWPEEKRHTVPFVNDSSLKCGSCEVQQVVTNKIVSYSNNMAKIDPPDTIYSSGKGVSRKLLIRTIDFSLLNNTITQEEYHGFTPTQMDSIMKEKRGGSPDTMYRFVNKNKVIFLDPDDLRNLFQQLKYFSKDTMKEKISFNRWELSKHKTPKTKYKYFISFYFSNIQEDAEFTEGELNLFLAAVSNEFKMDFGYRRNGADFISLIDPLIVGDLVLGTTTKTINIDLVNTLDTIPVIGVVSDTSFYRRIYGLSGNDYISTVLSKRLLLVRKKHVQEPWGCINCLFSDYWEDICFLNLDKKILEKDIVVWQYKEYK